MDADKSLSPEQELTPEERERIKELFKQYCNYLESIGTPVTEESFKKDPGVVTITSGTSERVM
jgi:hypothetical protein